jgi:hypothetical protein
MTEETFNKLRIELSIKLRNGFPFILGGCIVWLLIFFIWFFGKNIFYNNLSTAILSGMVSMFAFIFSKVLKIPYSVPKNPLGMLGLILSLSSIFFIPFNFILLFKVPDYLVISLATITGTHFFPYFWLYKTRLYAIFSGIIVIGVFFMGVLLLNKREYLIALFMFTTLGILSMALYKESKIKEKNTVRQNDA